MASAAVRVPIYSTAGAIPIKNDKGEITMQKVKVSRYVAGKRPEYAQHSDEEEDSDEEVLLGETFMRHRDIDDEEIEKVYEKAEQTDRRLRRLQERVKEENEDEDVPEARHRRLHEPEVIAMGDEEMSGEEDEDEVRRHLPDTEESSDEEEMDEEAQERRRKLLRDRARQKEAERDLLDLEEEKSEEEEEESSEYEEYSDSEEETGPRLKPVFVRKTDRVTVQEREKMEFDATQEEEKKKKILDERKKVSRKLVEELVKKELQEQQGVDNEEDIVLTDDDNDEVDYEAWKVRELKRIKRDREEREQVERERQEVERIHSMTEEERRAEQRQNPKQVTNKAVKGKYKFLQKYYHRGAFFLDNEEGVYKQDFCKPTLEDHFDKTILPKVMQVKNFGRSGRTKYTHLVDQDTTQFESAWAQGDALSLKFQTQHAGGSKQVFERPSKKRK